MANLLLISRDAAQATALSAALAPDGHALICAADAHAALAALQERSVDLVLVDERVAAAGSAAACAALRGGLDDACLPIIVLADAGALEATAAALDAGATSFVERGASDRAMRLHVQSARRVHAIAHAAERRLEDQRFLTRLASTFGASLDERALLKAAARSIERFGVAAMHTVLLSDRDAPRIVTFGAEPLAIDADRLRAVLERAQPELRVNFDPDEIECQFEPAAWPKPSARLLVTFALRGASPRPRAWVAIEPAGDWPSADVALFEDVMTQLAAPLENARLYANLSVAHDELADTLRKLRQAQTAIARNERLANIGMLAAGVAHEINNPLAFVISNLNVMREYARELGALVKQARQNPTPADASDEHTPQTLDPDFLLSDLDALIQESVEGANRMHGIVRNLRSFAHQSGNAQEEVEVHAAVESTLNLLSGEIIGNTTIVREILAVSAVRGDRGKLNQVFLNLIVNALHAIPSDRDGRVVVRLVQDASEVVFSVQDNGTGIPDSVLPHIFEPFYTTKESGRGTGLGLTLVEDIVHQHGGTIGVETKVGVGTTMTVRLPARSTLPMPAIVVQSAPSDEPPGVAIFIDDERFLLNAFKRAFTRVADVHLAQGGEEGIALLSELPHIDVVFCDLLMPRTSGIEVHAWIKANRPELLERFVVLTAGASEERYRMFLESADLKVITKPFSVHEVSELIQGYARSGRAARA